MNSIVLSGRLVREPELKTSSTSHVEYLRFTLASQRPGKHQQGNDQNAGQEADFIPCIAWRGRAKLIADRCHKGTFISVSGRMQSRSYTDASNVRHNDIECNVKEVDLLSIRQPKGSKAGSDPASAQAAAPVANPSLGDEDIPF